MEEYILKVELWGRRGLMHLGPVGDLLSARIPGLLVVKFIPPGRRGHRDFSRHLYLSTQHRDAKY
jgi:hypothetical protein